MAYCGAVTAVNLNTNVNTGAGGPGSGAWDGVPTSSFAVGVTRLLLVYQTTTPHQNGVWIWNGATTALSRPTAATDPFKTGAALDNATIVPVAAGGLQWGGSEWWVSSPPTAAITVDTTSLTLIRKNARPVQARLCSTSNISISSAPATIDGVTPAAGDIVLLVGQSAATANGLYTYVASGSAMTLTADPIYPNIEVQVSEGTTGAHLSYKLVSQGTVTVGTTALTFSRQILRANVRDFGATGNNSANDTAAIQAAYGSIASTGGVLTFPPGTYLCNSANFTIPAYVQVQFEQGAILSPSSHTITISGQVKANPTQQIFALVGTGAITLTTSASDDFPIKWWGSVGSGSGDDSVAFAAALASVASAGGGTLVLAPGTYRISTGAAVVVPSNVQLLFKQGAMLEPVSVNIAINGGILAHSTQQIFSYGTGGTVTVTAQAAATLSPKWWGALGNTRSVTDGVMSSTTNPTFLTSATASFTAADVGSNVVVAGAGAAGANLATTIASVTNSTTVVLSVACTTSASAATVLVGIGDSVAIFQAYSAMSGGILEFPPGGYYVGTSFQPLNVPPRIATRFARGAVLTPAPPNQVILNGPVEAPPTQAIFGGFGAPGAWVPTNGNTTVTTVSGSYALIPTTRVKMIAGGMVGTATFQYSLNGGSTWSATQITAASYAVPNTNLVIGFPPSTYAATDTFAWVAAQTLQTGTGPAVTVGGCASGSYSFLVKVIAGGALGGALTLQYSLNGGTTWSATTNFPTGAPYQLVVPRTGVTLNFAAGTYAAGNMYAFQTYPPGAVGALAAHEAPLKWWNAAGDGVTDDSAAVSNACAGVGVGVGVGQLVLDVFSVRVVPARSSSCRASDAPKSRRRACGVLPRGC